MILNVCGQRYPCKATVVANLTEMKKHGASKQNNFRPQQYKEL